jgi:ankyrin repeat protein
LVNSKDLKNETLLSYAIKRKNIEIAKLILSSPILDITYQDNKGNSYLHLAVISQLEEITKLLIKKGININLQNNDGNTALHLAYNTGDIIFIAALVENNSDLNIKNKDGLIPDEIQMDSIPDNLDFNNNVNNSKIFKTNDKNISNNIKNDKNDEKYDNILLTEEKSKINESIKINFDKIESIKETINNKNKKIVKNNTAYFNYIDKDNDDNNKEKKNEEENHFNTDENKYEYHNNKRYSDIFDLTSSDIYKEKLANLTCINSHTVGFPNILMNTNTYENDDDIVCIKKMKTSDKYNPIVYDTEFKNINHKNNNRKKPPKTEFEKEKEKNLNLFTIGNKKNDHKANIPNTFESTASISKAEIDMANRDKKNEKFNNNCKDTISIYKNNNRDDIKLIFSSFENSKESLQQKNNENHINLDNQQNLNNAINIIKISNSNHTVNSNISSNLNSNTIINESISQSQEFVFNSQLDIDLKSTAEDLSNKSKLLHNSQTPLYLFLLEIKLEKYYNILNSNGFDDIQLLIEQTKTETGITDIQLKEIGVDIPGDRAKILIRLQEKAENFNYHIPKNVYYICNDLEHYLEDNHIQKLYQWLKTIKLEKYLNNFINGGYHCIELMLVQMESKNPITDILLKDDLGIDKIGYRARIINKLQEDAKKFNNKLKNSTLIFGKGETEKICECIIF